MKSTLAQCFVFARPVINRGITFRSYRVYPQGKGVLLFLPLNKYHCFKIQACMNHDITIYVLFL